MFDEILCNTPLPDDRVPPDTVFQTKSINSGQDRYTITKQGRLIFHKVTYDMTQGRLVPASQQDIDMDYHGTIIMRGGLPDKPIATYLLIFTRGSLEEIRDFDCLSDFEKARIGLWL